MNGSLLCSPILLVALVIATQEPTARAAEPPSKALRDRSAFLEPFHDVKVGMPEKEVTRILGKPDETSEQTEPLTGRASHFYAYGVRRPHGFPTFGQVVFDEGRHVHYLIGYTGKPPPPGLLPEPVLAPLLDLIDRCPAIGRGSFDPKRLIAAANELHSLGKDKSLAALKEYRRVSGSTDIDEPSATPWRNYDNDGKVELLLRCLFELETRLGSLPPPGMGLPYPNPTERWPRFPLFVVRDIPLLGVTGYALIGGQGTEPDIGYFAKHCEFRAAPLRPGARPFTTVESLLRSEPLGRLDAPAYNTERREFLFQLLALTNTVYRPSHDVDVLLERLKISNGPSNEELDRIWTAIQKETDQLDIRWNDSRQAHTFKDGSVLK